MGIWCQNDVVSTSMRRHHVASTLIRRHFGTKCPLGYVLRSHFFICSAWSNFVLQFLKRFTAHMVSKISILRQRNSRKHCLLQFLCLSIFHRISHKALQRPQQKINHAERLYSYFTNGGPHCCNCISIFSFT